MPRDPSWAHLFAFWLQCSWWLLTHHWTRYVVAWAICLGLTYGMYVHVRKSWDDWTWVDTDKQTTHQGRADGNSGHTTIDFGGQWIMGRMLVRGYGRELYNRKRLWEVTEESYPVADESPNQSKHDGESLVYDCFMGKDNDNEGAREAYRAYATPLTSPDTLVAITLLAAAQPEWTDERLAEVRKKSVGGLLYPPVNAFYMAPLAWITTPREAYAITQYLTFGYLYLAGLAISVLTRGRIWMAVAIPLIMYYPGFRGSIMLGQNSCLTLMIVLWGWALAARGYPVLGGMVWGLLCYKPVWGLAFFLVPLVTGRWKMCLAMVLTGWGIVFATLPFVGVQTWFDWLAVGKYATKIYDTDYNWIHLSRDLLGIPRRYLLNFDESSAHINRPEAAYVGWALYAVIVGLTLTRGLFAQRSEREAFTGTFTGMLMIGAAMSCYHFMYYDILLTLVGVVCLLDPPARLWSPTVVAWQQPDREPPWQGLDYFAPRLAATHPSWQRGKGIFGFGAWTLASPVLVALALLFIIENHLERYKLSATLQANFLPPITRLDGETLPATADTSFSATTEISVQTWKMVSDPDPTVPPSKVTCTSNQTWKLVIDPHAAVHPRKVTFLGNTMGTPLDTYVVLLLWLAMLIYCTAMPPTPLLKVSPSETS